MSILITFDGVNGSGKTTVIKRLKNRMIASSDFNGYSIHTYRCPGDGIPKIRRMFKDPKESFDGMTDLFLACADVSELMHKHIFTKPKNSIILVDRFIDSTFAYQKVFGGVNSEVIEICTSLSIGEKRPDLTLIFDIPFKVSEERRKEEGFKDRFEKEFQTKFNELRMQFKLRQKSLARSYDLNML